GVRRASAVSPLRETVGPRKGVASMDTTLCVLYVCVAALVGLLAGYGVARFLDRFRLNSSQARVAEISDTARKEAENILKEAQLRAKDELYQKREEFNREMEVARNEVRDHERRLEKREDTLEQKHQLQVKKERTLEHTQRKL